MVGLGLDGFGLVGVGTLFWTLITIVTFWDLVWKLLAMWKAAKKKSPIWFVALAIFNTIGILPILYYFVFSEWKKGKKNKK